MPIKDRKREEVVPLSNREDAVFQHVAELYGISVDEAVTRLASEELARKFKKGTGETPAKVYQLTPRKVEK